MLKGTVKWFNNVKGYGFLTSDETQGRDVFVHHASIEMEGYKTLKPDGEVAFEFEEKPDGRLAATKVVPVSYS